jgi:hypothetical protein
MRFYTPPITLSITKFKKIKLYLDHLKTALFRYSALTKAGQYSRR